MAGINRLGKAYLFFKALPGVSIDANGKTIIRYSIGNLMRVEGHTLVVDFGRSYPLAINGDLVGTPAIQFSAKAVGASSGEDVCKAFNWFDSQTNGWGTRILEPITVNHILGAIGSHTINLSPMTPITAVVHLYSLHKKGIGVRPKITELKSRLRGHHKAINNRMEEKALDQIDDLATEFEFANIASDFNHRIRTSRKVDMNIDGVETEIKNHHSLLTQRDLSRLIQRGILKQSAELLVIRCPDLRDVNKELYDIEKMLDQALRICKSGRHCVLFYSRYVWDRIYKADIFVP